MANALPLGAQWRGATINVQVSPALVCIAAVVLIVCLRLNSHGAALLTSLGDTDDATRLVQLGAFLEHGRWWDLRLERIGAPDPVISHWSRLVDLGLAVIFKAASLVLDPARAELAMRIVWPSLVLLGLLILTARDAERDGGALACVFVAAMVVMSSSALYQFRPGRIDHHNVQILCGVGGILLLARSVVAPAIGWWAGALIGLGLTVGLEAATLLGPALVVAILIGLGRRRGLEGQMRAVVAMAAALAIGVFISIAPHRLGVMACDAVALNLVALVGFGAAGVVGAALAAQRLEGPTLLVTQLAWLGGCGVAGLVVYGLLEPRCLAGPFGQVAAETWPVWLSRVTEGQPIGYLFSLSVGSALGFVLLALLGIAARAWLALQERATSGEGDRLRRQMLLLAVQTLAFVAACWQVKMLPYAAWLALPALAVAIARLPGTGALSATVVRLAALLLVLETTLATLAGGAAAMVAKPDKSAVPPVRTSCSETQTISALAALPPGLVLGDINLGPYVVALTPHRVVMAPYHRLDRSIVEGHALLAGEPQAMESRLRKLGVDYVVACRTPESAALPGGVSAADKMGTLKSAVATGTGAGYLAPVPLPSAPTLSVFRVLAPKG
jgi:hypothetical protein